MRKNSATARHRAVVLAVDGVIPFHLAIPAQVLGSATAPDGSPLYEVLTCSVDGRPVRTAADFDVAVPHGPEVIETADTLILTPGDPHGRCATAPLVPEGLAEALDRLRPGARLVSLCTAAFYLAALGRLGGRRATTHWLYADQLARGFPEVVVDPDVLYVDDGDVLTSAGAGAGVDLCLHLVRADHGSAVANVAARRSVVAPHREGGQQQFIEHPVPEVALASTAPARAWAVERLASRLTLEDMAAEAHMSVRTFTRRFRDEVGVSPRRWLTEQRVDLARRLLETTDLPVEHVAAESGFGTAAALRLRFAEEVGVSPTAYRRTFRAEPVAA